MADAPPAGQTVAARELHARMATVLASSNQHSAVSICFFKHLRQRERLFATALYPSGVAELDVHLARALEVNLERIIALQDGLRKH